MATSGTRRPHLDGWKFYDGTTTQTYAFKSDTLAAFAATTSAQFLGVISDEVGSGSKVAKFDSVSGNSGIAAQSTGSLTSGNVPKFDASGNIVDGSVVAANIVTQTSNASSGQVCTYTGANKVCVPATALPSGVTATTQTAKDNTTKVATTAYVDNPVGTTTGTSVTLTAPSQIFVCTSTCTITMPVPAAGYQFCVYNGDNVTTVITFAAIGSSARYENAARTAYGTAGTGTLVSGGAAKDYACLLGLDSTHYLFVSGNGTWVAN
jgi:hypothetical protein